MPIVVEKGRAETLVLYPPKDFLAVPSAADIRVGTPAVSLPDEGSETSITANIDAVNTTLSAAASRGDTSVTVTSATGITAGRRYLVTSLGARHTPTIQAVVSTTVYLTEPLRADLASGATFQGIATTHQLTTGETATAGEGHVIYRLTLSGIVRRIDDVIRVVERIFPITLTPDRLCQLRPEAARLRDAADQTMGEIIESGWDLLRFEINSRGLLEERIRTPSVFEMAHVEACLLRLYQAAEAPIEKVDAQRTEFLRTVDKTLTSRVTWYDDVGSSSSGITGKADLAFATTVWMSR